MQEQAIQEIQAAETLEALQLVKTKYVGKSGLVTRELGTLGKLPPEERKARGAEINVVRQAIQAALDEKEGTLKRAVLADPEAPCEDVGCWLTRSFSELHPGSPVASQAGGGCADGPSCQTGPLVCNGVYQPVRIVARTRRRPTARGRTHLFADPSPVSTVPAACLRPTGTPLRRA